MKSLSTLKTYWPAIVAGLGVAYVAASQNWSQLPAAITTLIAALGVNQSVASAHAKIASLKQ